MTQYRYILCDVFTSDRFAGNQLAVFPDAAGLNDAQMQAIARELNLSETTFVTPAAPPRTASVRIFTPGRELPFAGHPTIGTAFALTMLGRLPEGATQMLLAEAVGDVPVRIETRSDPFMAWLVTPPIEFGEEVDSSRCSWALGLSAGDLIQSAPPQIASAGAPFLFAALRDASTVDRATLNAAAVRDLNADATFNGIFFFAPTPKGAYARMFAPALGIAEDPATGSAAGPLAAYMVRHRLLDARDGVRLVVEQGTKMLRRSLLHVSLGCDASGALETVEVGGNAVFVAEGFMEADA
ncbi:MAG TPA: PhzF family phenazine biosynthesis protein [Candidatus Baltobacteraceae bacterium]|jgi:trans-2,3-dihydro-3-hydroxyanthranilate isomerase